MRTLVLIILIFLCFEVQSQVPILLVKDHTNTSVIENDLDQIGFSFDTISTDLLNYQSFLPYKLVIISSGSNPLSCEIPVLRNSLLMKIEAGEMVLIEGGQIGFRAAVTPLYLAFRNKALHIYNWISDQETVSILNPLFSSSELSNNPNILSDTFTVMNTDIYSVDVVSNDDYSKEFYLSSVNNDNCLINVYPDVNNPQIIYFSFDYSKIINRLFAAELLQNCVVNLMDYNIGIKKIGNEIAGSFSVYEPYPNPFNGSVKIDFDIPFRNNAPLLINIFDVRGRIIKSFKEILEPGRYTYLLDFNTYPSGIYFISFTSTENLICKKLVYTK